jgi:uncharacterized repeat protein (TIGR03803 family)
MSGLSGVARAYAASAVFAIMLTAGGAAGAHGLQTIYTFTGGTDGTASTGPLLRDAAGNLYGVSFAGGSGEEGTVFMLSPGGVLTPLHDFVYTIGQPAQPTGGVVMDGAGNLYGEAMLGGALNCSEIPDRLDCGSVYKLAPNGTLTTLHSFQGGTDGDLPSGGLLIDKAGNLYGTTQYGGTPYACGVTCGLVFKISASGTYTVLHNFQGGTDGNTPMSNLIADRAGNLYGTTLGGGDGNGTVFKLARDGTETVLYAFQGGADGSAAEAGVVMDRAGDIYGTTMLGGNSEGEGFGTVYKLTPGGVHTVLHSFMDSGGDGVWPRDNLLIDNKGDVYGTTKWGGAANCHNEGCGTLYNVASDGTYSLVYLFRKQFVVMPLGGLTQDAKGNLFGSGSTYTAPYYGVLYTTRK